MKILGIETSCDETALCILDGSGDLNSPSFSVLGTSLFSQVKIHEQYGGVFPALAKREHAKNLVPLLKNLLQKTNLSKNQTAATAKENLKTEQKDYLKKLLEKEPELFECLDKYIGTIEKPNIDAIAVTFGPGLEPALWVGINFAKALNYLWDIPIVPINHMEGHIVSVLASAQKNITFPALALLISGGHTELVNIPNWTKYEVVGQTRDDAVGEAFDKVARMLSLPYPGGPHISELAEKERKENKNPANKKFSFPRPMIHSHDFDFSFSGLKTSILYKIKELKELTPKIKQEIACEFEDAVVEVLLSKTKKAIEKYSSQSLIIGGGVIANTQIRSSFQKLDAEFPSLKVFVPEMSLTTDNAVMIAMAGYIQIQKDSSTLKTKPETIVAQGNIQL